MTGQALSGFLKIAGSYCKLTIQDVKLGKYIQKEYVLLQGDYRPVCEVVVARKGKNYCLSDGNLFHRIVYKKNRSYSEHQFVDFVVSSFVASRLLRKNILFIHGSSFVKNNKGFVYAGVSGAGKSTILQSVPKNHILSDDTAVLKKTTTGFDLYPSPFDKKSLSSPTPAPLKGVYFLKQATSDKVEDVSTLVAFVFLQNYEVYAFAMKHFAKEEGIKKILSVLLAHLFQTVKTQRLLFTKKYRAYAYAD